MTLRPVLTLARLSWSSCRQQNRGFGVEFSPFLSHFRQGKVPVIRALRLNFTDFQNFISSSHVQDQLQETVVQDFYSWTKRKKGAGTKSATVAADFANAHCIHCFGNWFAAVLRQLSLQLQVVGGKKFCSNSITVVSLSLGFGRGLESPQRQHFTH